MLSTQRFMFWVRIYFGRHSGQMLDCGVGTAQFKILLAAPKEHKKVNKRQIEIIFTELFMEVYSGY